jgi:S1-C subfamily serine protease
VTRRFLALARALRLGFGAGAARAEDLVATVKRVKPAVIGIGTTQATRAPPTLLLGTGFVIGDGRHALTNAHVVNLPRASLPAETLAIFVATGETAEIRPARVIAADLVHDVAVLAFDGPPLPALDLGDDAEVAEGQSIAMTGFPIGAVLGLYPATHRGIVAAWTPIAIPAIEPGQLDAVMIKRLREDDFLVLQLDLTALPGNNGSPLYRVDTGAVVGIVSSVFVKDSKESALSDPSGISYAIPIRYARDLLRAAGVRE